MANNTTEINTEENEKKLEQTMKYWSQQLKNIEYSAIGPYLVLIPFGIVGNLLIIMAFCRLKYAVGKSLRVYYIVLAISQLVNIVGSHLAAFVDYEMQLLTDNAVYWPISNDDLACQVNKGLTYLGNHCTNWTYVAMNLERLISVSQPLRAKFKLTEKRAWFTSALICVTSSPLIVLTWFAFGSTAFPYNSPVCGAKNKLGKLVVLVWRVLALVNVHFLPNLLALLLIVLVLWKLKQRVRVWSLEVASDRSGRHQRADHQATMTVILVSLVHCLFFVPSGVTAMYYTVLQQFSNDVVMSLVMFSATRAISMYSIIADASNAVIYYFRDFLHSLCWS